MRYFLFIFTTILVTIPTLLLAQSQTPQTLVQLPIDNQGSFDQYINILYKLSISVAALLAVVKIIIAGVKYMLTDVITNKGEAIKDIKGALFGLLLILGAVIVLNTINPTLTDGGLKLTPVERQSFKSTPPPVVPTAGGAADATAGGAAGAGSARAEAVNAAASESGKQDSAGGCNTRDIQTRGNFEVIVLNVTDCDSAGPHLMAFAQECTGKTGGAHAVVGRIATCAYPKPAAPAPAAGPTTTYGRVTQNKQTRTFDANSYAGRSMGVKLDAAVDACEDGYEDAVATPNETTWTVSCKIPTVVKYGASATEGSRGMTEDRANCTSLGGEFYLTKNACVIN